MAAVTEATAKGGMIARTVFLEEWKGVRKMNHDMACRWQGSGYGPAEENKIQLTLGSLFDGIAGFPLAAVRHGIKPV